MVRFGALGQRERVFDVHAELADRVLDLCIAEQDLHRAQASMR